MNALQAQRGLQHQNDLYGNESLLQKQLQQQAMGQGPNPALAQLQQTTGQNVANQAALMASQRGAGQNIGLIAREAAMQGANTQQQAVGQAAVMRAQQQLAAQQALQQQQTNMANLSGTMVGNQANALGNLNQYRQAQQQSLLNAIAQRNATAVSQQNAMNTANAGIAGQKAKGQSDMVGGLVNAAGMALGMSDGGMINDLTQPMSGPVSQTGMFLKGMNQGGSVYRGGGNVPGKAQQAGDSLKNDKVPALLSPKEIVLPRSITMSKDAPQKAAAFVHSIISRKR